MERRLLLLFAAVAAPALLAPAFADESPALIARSVKIVLERSKRGGSFGDRIRIRAIVPTEKLPLPYDAAVDGISVTVGGETVLSCPPVDDRARLDRMSGPRWRYRERRSKDRSGVRRLDLDVPSGHLRLKAKGLDLGALLSADPEKVPVVVTLGESVFTAELDLRAKGGVWKFRAEKKSFTRPPPDDELPPAPGAVSFRILDAGTGSAIKLPETAVARNIPEYAALWGRHSPPIPCVDPRMCPGVPVTPPPDVDFTKEIVVAVFLGNAVDGETADILSAVREGTGARVTWAEVRQGPTCPVPTYNIIPTPYVLAAITRVEGNVEFEKKVTYKSCP